MRVQKHAGGYIMSLNSDDTHKWAHRPENNWPCSQLSGHKLIVCVDGNGLYDIAVDNQPCENLDNNELIACVSDHQPDEFKQFWPRWDYTDD